MSTIVSSCTIHLELDGVNVTGPLVLPNTGGWGNWQTVLKPNIQISAGQHELKMVIETGGFLLESLSAIPSLPNAPSALTANAVSASQINLAWTDNSSNESGFKIERKTGPSGSYSEIATTAAGISSFSNTGLQSNTQYFYRLRATNPGGNSAYSNEASATTSNLLPSVTVTLPAAGTVFTALSNITIEASAADADGTVSKVEFYQGATKLGEDVTSPFAFTWNNVQQGSYSLSAVATDNRGASTTSTAVPITVVGSSISRLDPMNRTGGGGEDPLSRNFNWNLPLVSLPGRAGMDLDLSLSYNSLVWTKSGNFISFDDDRGFPSPGFRLGFPVIQPLYYNSEVGKYAFLLINPDGSRSELRQVGTSTLYEAVDSSYLLLNANTMTLQTTDGTQLSYAMIGSEYNCTKILDRNGNYITINYTQFGRIDTIIDTLARSIKFNYDANGWLTSITKVWNQGLADQVTHNWATFTYANTTIQTNFTGLTVYGPSNNSTIKYFPGSRWPTAHIQISLTRAGARFGR